MQSIYTVHDTFSFPIFAFGFPSVIVRPACVHREFIVCSPWVYRSVLRGFLSALFALNVHKNLTFAHSAKHSSVCAQKLFCGRSPFVHRSGVYSIFFSNFSNSYWKYQLRKHENKNQNMIKIATRNSFYKARMSLCLTKHRDDRR